MDYEEAKTILLKREYRTDDLVNLRAQMRHAHRILDKLTAPPSTRAWKLPEVLPASVTREN
jgi:hypothetical protein